MAQVCVSDDQLRVNANGELEVIPGTTSLIGVVRFTAGNHIFNAAAFPRLSRVRVRVWGGGGSGGGVPATPANRVSAGGGGAGGSFAESILTAAQLPGPINVAVGAGGNAALPAQNGNPGGASSFGGLVVAPGGSGGIAGILEVNAVASGGQAGQPIGDLWQRGSSGGLGQVLSDQVIRGTNWGGAGGGGGTAALPPSTPVTGGTGQVGHPTGGGSSGAWNLTSQPARGSQRGWDGFVVVEIYG